VGQRLGPIRASRTEHCRTTALLFDLLAVWPPEGLTPKRILVDNPENLYDFAKIF